jgi:NAD(P)-dependent dehydrogenase (short-subunit alcohol dehydrogenase family)
MTSTDRDERPAEKGASGEGGAPTLLMVGARTLGRAIAVHFAAQGWRVVSAARTRADVDRVAAEVDAAGGRGTGVVSDLTDPASLASLVAGCERIDLCIAAQTSGVRFGARPLVELADEEIDQGYRSYLRGTWNLLKAVGPKMLAQGAGTFLQIGTSSGVRTKDGFAALGAIQHGLRALVQVAAREWRAQGVHVAYLPIDGAIASEKTAAWAARNGSDRAIPQAEIARACAYLHGQEPRAWTHELVLRPVGTDWTAPT